MVRLGLSSTGLLTLFLSKLVIGQDDSVTVTVWTDSTDCTGDAVVQYFDYTYGAGYVVAQLDYTFQSAIISGGDTACGVFGCQYGSSCSGADLPIEWGVCGTMGSGYNFDKLMVDSCFIQ